MLFMKKIKLSLAALTLVLAVAGTTTVNATNSTDDVGPCWQVDPFNTECLDQTDEECCYSDEFQRVLNTKAPKPH